jgi:hypothetical protein
MGAPKVAFDAVAPTPRRAAPVADLRAWADAQER